MIYFQQLENENENTKISYAVTPGSKMLLHITISNTFSAPMVIQPSIKPLASEKNETAVIDCTFHPVYNYIPSTGKDELLCELDIPKSIPPNTTIKYMLNFSGVKHCSVELEFTIAEIEEDCFGQFYDRNLHVELPTHKEKVTKTAEASKSSASNLYMTSVLKLLKGLEIIEKSPSRQFATEILLSLCEIGERMSAQEDKAAFIRKLKRSIFFKNGVLVVAGSQILNWLTIADVVSNSYANLAGQANAKKRLLSQWEQWFTELFSLDLEREEIDKIKKDEKETATFQHILQKIDSEPDRFFLFLILGLMEVSPKIRKLVEDVCSTINYQESETQNTPQKMYANVINEEGSLQI
jgi:hypothetical protein